MPAGELRVGETLRNLDGDVRIESIEQLGSEERVYNLEIHGEHVFRVASSGLLVHNSSGAEGTSSGLHGANFAQKTFSETFSKGGKFSGKTIDDVADALRNGTLKPSDVPIEYATQGGQTIVLNTRSAEALRRAGISRDLWKGVDVSNDAAAMQRLADQLRRNGLGPGGIPNTRSGQEGK